MAAFEEPQSTICETDLCVEAAGCQYSRVSVVGKLKASNWRAWGTSRNRRSGYNQIAANRCGSWYGLYSPYELGNSAEQESREDASWELHWEVLPV